LTEAQPFSQADSLKFAGWTFGQLIDEDDVTRQLEIRQSPGSERQQIARKQLLTVAQHHGDSDLLSESGIGNCKRRGV
jgi:hypothetical protein